MTKIRLWLAVIALAGTTVLFPAGNGEAARSFTDVSGSYWAKEEISYLSGKQIITGLPDGSFGVNQPISRAEAAVMMMRVLGWGASGNQPDPGYPDVDPSHWAYDEITAVHHAGIFAPEGQFKPAQKLTRAEMADILVKTFDLTSHSGYRFADVSRDHWAYDAIQILAGNGITTGYDDGTFRPDNPVTRAEFAVFTARALEPSFRPDSWQERREGQVIYDIEIGDHFYQLNNPLLLTNTWMAPIELFEAMGFQVETVSADKVYITTTDGLQFSVERGQREVRVGGTLVEVKQGVEHIDGQPYIEVSNVLRALEKPLVYYPDQRLIRIESPRITAADIKRKAPETILSLIHPEQPYWRWTKTDSDYLELMRRDGLVAANREQLLAEMQQLTEAFFVVETEKTVLRGMNYYSDHVTGKIDAITRGLEARYLLLFKPEEYAYPAVGKSGAAGSWRFDDATEFAYTVSDYSFEHFAERKSELINVILSSEELSFERFRGLNIHGIPFSIREVHPDGSVEAFSGKAMGSSQMIVTNSVVGTFIHEFGHNWDAMFGDADEYLALRDKSGYTPPTNEWANRIEENFAEDFVAAYLPESYHREFRGSFGEPTEAQIQAFREWVRQREQSYGNVPVYDYTLNGASLAPSAILLKDGKLHVEGHADRSVVGEIVNLADGSVERIEIAAAGAFEHTLELPAKGVYHLLLGKFNTIVVYD